MITGTFDVIAAGCYAAAGVMAAYTVVTAKDRNSRVPALLLFLAMALMALVSTGHAFEQFGLSAATDASEDYAQVLFLPLITYMFYGLYARSRAEKEARERKDLDYVGMRLASSLEELGHYRVGMLSALTIAVDARDHYTALHSLHVADYACAIGLKMGMYDSLPLLEQAGLLHDIGKIGVPDALLLKPARLTDEEYAKIKTHVEASAQILETVTFLSEVVPAVRHHHERWDGSGYPDGLAASEIPLLSRLLAVADAFDAMTTDRPYRPAMERDVARANLIEGRGAQFDPAAVDAFIELLDSGIIMVQTRGDAA